MDISTMKTLHLIEETVKTIKKKLGADRLESFGMGVEVFHLNCSVLEQADQDANTISETITRLNDVEEIFDVHPVVIRIIESCIYRLERKLAILNILKQIEDLVKDTQELSDGDHPRAKIKLEFVVNLFELMSKIFRTDASSRKVVFHETIVRFAQIIRDANIHSAFAEIIEENIQRLKKELTDK